MPVGNYPVYFEGDAEIVPVYNRTDLAPGTELNGPLLVADNYTTILLPILFKLEVDKLQNIIIEEKI